MNIRWSLTLGKETRVQAAAAPVGVFIQSVDVAVTLILKGVQRRGLQNRGVVHCVSLFMDVEWILAINRGIVHCS
eukprot:127349-Amphidinium_carterae.1